MSDEKIHPLLKDSWQEAMLKKALFPAAAMKLSVAVSVGAMVGLMAHKSVDFSFLETQGSRDFFRIGSSIFIGYIAAKGMYVQGSLLHHFKKDYRIEDHEPR